VRLDDERARRWAERSVLVAVVAVPLVIVPSASDIFGLPKLLVAALATAVGWAALLLRPGGGRQRAPTRLEWAVLAYVAVVAVSTLTSRSRFDSILGSYERYGGLVPLLVFVAFCALVAVAFRGRPDRLALIPITLAVTAAVVAGYVVLQTLGIDVVDWKEVSGADVRYQAGTLGNADFAGGFLGIALPFAVAVTAAAVGRRRLLLGCAAALVAVAVGATRSRGGLLAAAVGIAVLAVLERERLSARVRLALVGTVAAVVIAGLVLLLMPASARPDVIDRTELFRTKSLEVRGREWVGAWKVFLDAPVLGTGPDTFEFGFPAVRSREDGAELGMQIADKPHNIVLEKLSDTGVLGAAAYLAVLGSAFALARRRPRGSEVFVAGLAAYVAQGLVSVDVTPLAFMGWALIGALVAAAGDPVPPGTARPTVVPGGRLAGAAALVVVVVGLVVVAETADLAAGDGNWRTAIARHPAQPFYRYGAAAAAEKRGAEAGDATARRAALDEAVRRFDEVLAFQPRSVFAVIGRARVETLAARTLDRRRFAQADRWWRRAAQVDPRDWEVHNAYGLMLNAWANAARGDRLIRARAAEELEAALRIKADHVPALVNLARIRSALGDAAGAREAAARALRYEPGNPEATALARG
jgi:O-antigen ligase